MTRVLVLDGDTRAALAVTRSLGRRGCSVSVGEKRTPSLAQTSKYCCKRIQYPDPAHDEAGFLESVRRAVRESATQVLLPMTDVTTALIARHAAEFEPFCLLPFPDAATVDRAADKLYVLRRAQALGVPVPRSWVVDRQDATIPVDVAYPIVVKPHRSRVRTPQGWRGCTVSHAHDRDQLVHNLGARDSGEFPVLLQERIVGAGTGVFLSYDRGKLLAAFAHRRLREKPPWGGVSVLCESMALSPAAKEYAQRLLEDLQWRGAAMVEFKVDDRDGLPKLMEINGRFWGSLQLAIDSGVDFPAILLDALANRAPATPPSYRVGVRSRWFWGDMDALLLTLRSRARHPELPEGVSRIQALAGALKMWGRDLHYDNPKFSDPKPWFYETARWLRG